MDLKKEIKLSDLFRRSSGPAEEDAPKAEKPPKEKKERKSFSFSRGPKEPKAPKEPQAAKENGKVSPKDAPAPPAVPLMRAFDLMPKESEREKSSASPAFLKVVLALVAILVLAGLAGAFMLMDARAKERQAVADDLRAQLAEIEAQATEDAGPNTATLTAEGQARTAALSEALAARVAWDRILREFSLVLPEDVWLTTLASSTPTATAVPNPAAPAGATSTFTISGFATSQEAVAQLLSRLEVIPEFASVQLQSSSRGTAEAEGGSTTSGDPQDFSFSIVATIAPQGVPAQ
jgi:Tfp pilus assembly protein PilN